MEQQSLEQLKYPIGPLTRKEEYSGDEIQNLITTIQQAPEQYRLLSTGLSAKDLDKMYRPGSWTIGQLFHHVADIQLLHLLRMKKALTEKDYRDVTLIDMDAWVTTADVINAPIADSLDMLESITKRYVVLLRSLTKEQLAIEYYHPVRKYTINQAQAINMSAWHLQHHLAHIKLALA
ncbi:MAG: hypothetical protein EOO04_07145 [Chitinophagaceae bacterium]|nr:MAG: hypothetical protein EOO04_07145 [Chitinophagaceae bacterium]